MTSNDNEGLRRSQQPNRGGYVALAVATGYAGVAWHLKDPGAAVVVFQAVLIALGRRPGRK
ncbi:hypothetical protein ACWDTP_12240 [Mycobacterium sp. NPDC003449]